MAELTKNTKVNNINADNNDHLTKELLIHLTIWTEVIKRKEDDDLNCICSNHIKPTSENQGNLFFETEIVPSLSVPITPEGKIKLCDVLNKLRLIGYPITGSMINLFMKNPNDFVFVGADPIDPNLIISSDEVDLECFKIKLINRLDENILKNLEPESEEKTDDKKKEKRTKERKIGFIIEKVNGWRKLYNGFYNENGEHTRYSLDQAAKIIDISKKSLDDYLLQLRLGRKYGFDFNKYQNEKVGMLRVFVKSKRNPDLRVQK